MNKFVLRGYSWVAFIFCIITIGVHLFLYPKLPSIVPYHWNIHGEVDRTGPKYLLLIFSCLPMIMYGFLLFFPNFDRKKNAYNKHKKAYSVFLLVIVLFLSVISVVILLISLGYSIDIISALGAILGMTLLITGNYMRQIRPNSMFGIRTPWSIASERNWRSTHRLGSVLFALSGLLMIISALIQSTWLMILGTTILILSSIFLFIYSYLLSKK
ncbi:Uncharacterized membrane protein [Seinonella peptonophila]|uniref:Uncharacterized membrane protein n=1 Tax=Seinonella peptonophila TaxID=112248 RepID=A0A1M5B268_9BACL|nr:SdpI family protein [Seinonella peptonophila]SHF36555.1 Uncharacterized membrane protein [Seinonella peptonophila]